LGSILNQDPPDEIIDASLMEYLARTKFGYTDVFRPGGAPRLLQAADPTRAAVSQLFPLIDSAKDAVNPMRQLKPLAMVVAYINAFAFSFAYFGVLCGRTARPPR
jgi:hypothetical protein